MRWRWPLVALALVAGCDERAPAPSDPTGGVLSLPPLAPTARPAPPKPAGEPPLVLEGPACWLWSPPPHRRVDPGERLGLGRSGECYFASYYAADPRGCEATAEGACRGGLGECGGAGDGLSVWFFTQDGPGTCRLTFRLTNAYRETVSATVEFEVGSR